jgi:hypothetical protein
LDIESEGQLDHMIAEEGTDAHKSVAIGTHGMYRA